MPDGEICIANPSLVCEDPRSTFTCSLPATSESQAADFLEAIGNAGVFGDELKRLGGINKIISEYKREFQRLTQGVKDRRTAGQLSRRFARQFVAEQRQIADQMRWRYSPGASVLFEIRDWGHSVMGSRSLLNLEQWYQKKGLRGARLNEAMIKDASKSNVPISAKAVRGARYLERGGRIIVRLSWASTLYRILTASPQDREKLIYEEVGDFAGGYIGGEAAVGACLVFGIASGGWGLLACGVVGGIGGGLAGSYAGDRLYYSNNKQVEESVQATGILDSSELSWSMPPQMCIAP